MQVSDTLVEQIRQHLAERDLRPGDRLPAERALAEELGVSRPSLREASRRLVELGVLHARRGAGTYVGQIDLRDLMVVRRRLEPLAAELAAQGITPEQSRRLRDLIAELGAAVDDTTLFPQLDLELHTLIAQASGNAVLMRCLADLDQMLRVSRSRTATSAATRKQALRELTRLADAVVAGRPHTAATAMEAHLSAIAEALQGAE